MLGMEEIACFGLDRGVWVFGLMGALREEGLILERLGRVGIIDFMYLFRHSEREHVDSYSSI
jgi:hypothetical protein